MFNRASALQCIEKIKSSCESLDEYHFVLGDVILKNSLPERKHALDSGENTILTSLFKDHPQAFRELLFRELHSSWYTNIHEGGRHHNVNIPLLPAEFQQVEIPAMLVWGYELRLKRIEEVSLFHNLDEYSLPLLNALWEAIKISRILSVKGLNFGRWQCDESWKISCNGIINSSLTSFGLKHLFGIISPEIWKLFWNSLKQSSIRHLDFCFADFHSCSDEFWEIFFNGLGESNLLSISFERMGLSKLSTSQLSRLRQAIGRSKLVSVDLTCNHLNDAIEWHTRNCPKSWKIICDIIRLPSLRHVKLLELDTSGVSDNGWKYLCDSLKESKLKKLEFALDDYSKPVVTEERWLYFLHAIEKLPLESLVLHTGSANSVTTEVLQHICRILDNGTIRSFILHCEHSYLDFESAEWKLLGKTLKENGIETCNIGPVDLKEENNFINFSEGLKGSGIRYIYLNRSNLGGIPQERWNQMANFFREEGIRGLNLIDDYSLDSQWESFCHFLVNSGIREIAFTASNDNGLKPNQIALLSQSIQKSQLESFSFEGLACNMGKISANSFRILCDGIRNSNIFRVIHPWVPGKLEGSLSETKHQILKETLKAIEPRILYRKSLEALCAHSLMKSNVRLTETGVEFEIQDLTLQSDLTENQKNILKRHGIQ